MPDAALAPTSRPVALLSEAPSPSRRGAGGARAVLIGLALATTACAGHSARTREARSALDIGRPEAALAALNEELGVGSAAELPEKLGGDNGLLLLDRAMVLQAIASTRPDGAEAYRLSSRDLRVADKQIELLDLSRNATEDIGRYLFSDDTGPYKAPAYEKLMINTMNMVNYLALGDLNGARVEARRLAILQRFLEEHEGQGASLLGPGSYFAGFVFEKSGGPQEALRHYDEALQYGRYPSLHDPVRRLARDATYRTPRIRRILKNENADEASQGEPVTMTSLPEAHDVENPGADAAAQKDATDSASADAAWPGGPEGEVLVIISFGRVPAKHAERVPIGLALTYASGFLSPAQHRRASYLAAQGLVTWINYPELGKPRGAYDRPGFALDGAWQRLEGALAVDREAARAWEEAKGAVIASALTRMITRVAAGEVARRTAGGGILGVLLSLGTQATLTAVDTPDTRSWATLPARIAVGRVRLPPGTHWIDLEARGVRKRQRVTLEPGGWAVVTLTALS